MKEMNYRVTNRLGIHARCAGLFAQSAAEWKSAVTVSCGDRAGNGKQVLDILGLGVANGDEVRITVEGEDEDRAAKALQELLPGLFS